MTKLLKTIFSPILNVFEKGDSEFSYKPSHRKILIALGLLFWLLSGVSAYFSMITGELGAVIPIVVFFGVGFVSIVVASLGSDRAVAKIWKSK